MANEPTLVTDPHPGTALAALIGRQRTFVQRMIEKGPVKGAVRKAAIEAGYTPEHGYNLMREPAILAAIREEATRQVAGAGLVGVQVLIDIAQTTGHKDQFQAAKHLAALNGFTAEQRIVVEHLDRTQQDKIQEVRLLAEQLGLDPRTLIESAGIVIDAEFTVVEPSKVDDSDW